MVLKRNEKDAQRIKKGNQTAMHEMDETKSDKEQQERETETYHKLGYTE